MSAPYKPKTQAELDAIPPEILAERIKKKRYEMYTAIIGPVTVALCLLLTWIIPEIQHPKGNLITALVIFFIAVGVATAVGIVRGREISYWEREIKEFHQRR